MAAVGVLDPHLVVAMGAFDGDVAELACVGVPFLGVDHIRNFSLFLSNFAMALWYITPTQGLSSRSNSRSSVPSDHPCFDHGDRILRDFAGLRVHLAEEHLPKSEYQALPWRSSINVVRLDQGFGRSYSVMITRVDLPVSRGSVLSG